MATIKTDRQWYDAIAAALRQQLSTTYRYLPREMAPAVLSIGDYMGRAGIYPCGYPTEQYPASVGYSDGSELQDGGTAAVYVGDSQFSGLLYCGTARCGMA